MAELNPLDTFELDLNGSWRVIHNVRNSKLSRYVGLQIEFFVTLNQDNGRVTGDGTKFAIGPDLAGRNEVSRLVIEGRVDGTAVELSLVERAPARPEREIVGKVLWRAISPNRLLGSFRVDAAESSGSSEAIRA